MNCETQPSDLCLPPADASDPVFAALLAIEDGTGTPEGFITALAAARARRQILENAEAHIEHAFVRYLERSGPIEVGQTRYWAGHRKVTKCINAPAVLEALLCSAAGSIEGVAGCLVSNPFKLTEIDLLLGSRPAAWFVTESKPDLKEGKPIKRLQSVDRRFMKARSRRD